MTSTLDKRHSAWVRPPSFRDECLRVWHEREMEKNWRTKKGEPSQRVIRPREILRYGNCNCHQRSSSAT